MKTSKAVWLVILAFVGVLVLSAAAFALTVALSGPKGVGEGIIKKNSVENWTAAQAQFEEDYQSIIVADQKIGTHTTALAADPENPVLQTNLTGIISVCQSQVGTYNANARKYLAEEFRAADLPAQIDPFDTATDCK